MSVVFFCALQFIRDTVIASFASNDCGLKSSAIVANPTQVDYTPPMTFSNVAFVDVRGIRGCVCVCVCVCPSLTLRVMW
jgi:hypothetical protein